MASTEGGMDIEEVAEKTPEKIFKERIDPATGIMPFQARKVAAALGLKGDLFNLAAKFVIGVFTTWWECDAAMVEINPMCVVELADGKESVVALDAKISLDDNGLYRHKDILEMRDLNEEAPLEIEASKFNLNYIKLDGNIACLVNGAGLAMATMDIIQHFGGMPANFLDVGGGASKEQVAAAFKIILQDPNVKGILVNIFGGIMDCNVIATGIVAAVKETGLKLPLVVRLEGNNVAAGKKTLAESGLTIIRRGFHGRRGAEGGQGAWANNSPSCSKSPKSPSVAMPSPTWRGRENFTRPRSACHPPPSPICRMANGWNMNSGLMRCPSAACPAGIPARTDAPWHWRSKTSTPPSRICAHRA